MPMQQLTPIAFENEMRRWAVQNVPLIGKRIHGAVTEFIYNGIVQKTPVLTSRARGNWFPSMGAPSDQVGERTAGVSLTGQPVTSEEKARIKTIVHQLEGVALGSSATYITNNLDYIDELEEGTLSKKSAPNAMVQGTIINTLDGLKVEVVLKGIR